MIITLISMAHDTDWRLSVKSERLRQRAKKTGNVRRYGMLMCMHRAYAAAAGVLFHERDPGRDPEKIRLIREYMHDELAKALSYSRGEYVEEG